MGQEEADHTEQNHHVDVDHRVADGKGANGTEHNNHRSQQIDWHPGNISKILRTGNSDNHERQIREKHTVSIIVSLNDSISELC